MDLVLHIWLIDSMWVHQQLNNMLTNVCDVLIDKDKLFSKYINIPSCQCLKDIIACFENLRCIPNICEVINGIHILLVDLSSKRLTLASGDFFNKKKIPYYCVASYVM
jgi:hypothetical protein